jgi:hypothetical protein
VSSPAAYQRDLARKLIAAGADVRASNRRGAELLHHAANGIPGWHTWNPRAQAATIACLVAASAQMPSTRAALPLKISAGAREDDAYACA